MARRRSCLSCGQEQTGSNAFCSSCGKPLDTPDLELLSAGSINQAEGADIDMSRTFSRGRTLGLLAGVVALLAGVAAFSGNGTKSSSTSSTTTTTPPSTNNWRPTTTSTTALTTTTIGSTVVTSFDSNPSGSSTSSSSASASGPLTLPTPPLPGQKTGAKVLLLGLLLDGQTKDSILDVDSGVVHRLTSDVGLYGGDSTMGQIEQTAHGLMSANLRNNTIDVWHSDGAVAELPRGDLGGGPQFLATGDTAWLVSFKPQPGGGLSFGLSSLDLISGVKAELASLPQNVELVGTDVVINPVLQVYGSGAFAWDLATSKFRRVSPGLVLAARAGNRVEQVCDDALSCSVVFRGVDGTSRELSKQGTADAQYALSPDGRHVVVTKQAQTGQSVVVVDTTTLVETKLGNGFSFSNGAARAAWSNDGTWLFMVIADHIVAWRDGLTEPLTLMAGDVPLRAASIGVFPS